MTLAASYILSKVDLDGSSNAAAASAYISISKTEGSTSYTRLTPQQGGIVYVYDITNEAYLRLAANIPWNDVYFKRWEVVIAKGYSNSDILDTITLEDNPSVDFNLAPYTEGQTGTYANLYLTITLYVTLTATYTISFDLNGGSGDFQAIQADSGSATLPSETPTRNGYTFLGWSISSSSTTAEYSAGQTITVSGDLVLFAIWQKNTTPPTPGGGDGSLVYNSADSLLVFTTGGNLAYY